MECQTRGGAGECEQKGSQKTVIIVQQETYKDRIYTSGQTLCGRCNGSAARTLQSTRNHQCTYCERGEGHAHATEAVESQGNEDKDREFCK